MASEIITMNVGDFSNAPHQDLVFTTSSPGGCNKATWKETHTFPDMRGHFYSLGDDVEIFDKQGLIWKGRLEVINPTAAWGSLDFTFTALGYASSLRDIPIYLSPWSAALPSVDTAELARFYLQFYAPSLNQTDFSHIPLTRVIVPPGEALLNPANTATIVDELNTICTFGNSQGQLLYWHVWPTESGISPYLELVPAPSYATYYITLAEGPQLDIDWDISRVYNSVWVQYEIPSNGPIFYDYIKAENYASQRNPPPLGLGFVRRLQVGYTPPDYSNLSLNLMNNMATTLLNYYSTIHPLSKQMQVFEGEILQYIGGGDIPAWRARAGNVVRIRCLLLNSAFNGATSDYDFYISGTSYDVDLGQLTLTFTGQEGPAQILGRYIRDQGFV